jgi:tetratricopeptide (TPR) repeat protein
MKKIITISCIIFLFGCSKNNFQTEIYLNEENAKKYIEVKKNYSKKDFNLALKQINEIISEQQNFINAHFMKGKILFFIGKVIEAKNSFLEAISINPYHIDSLFWLSRINSYKENDWKDAQKYLERILFVNSDNARANYNLAQLFVKMNKIPEAIMRFEKALTTEFNLPYIHFNLGMLYKKLNIPEKAKKHFEIIALRYKDNQELISKLKEIRH